MNQDKFQHTSDNAEAGLGILFLAFFAPVSFYNGVLTVKPAMLATYAGVYMRRNIIAALLTYAGGELFNTADYVLLGTAILAMFVIFSGLCGVYLAAMFGKHRNHS